MEFKRAWKEHANAAAPRVMTYEPHYEGSPIVFGPPHGVSSAHGSHTFKARAGHHLPPQLSQLRTERVRGARRRISPCWPSMPTTGRSRTSSRGRRALRVPLKVVRDSYRDGRTAYEAA